MMSGRDAARVAGPVPGRPLIPLPEERLARSGDQPTVSVVIASAGEPAALAACLASLLPQCQRLGAELVVARAAEPAEIAQLEAAYPTVRFSGAPRESTLRQLRVAGMRAAQGDIVALAEDHRVVADDWLARMLPSRKTPTAPHGGILDEVQREHAIAGSPPAAFPSNDMPV